MLQRPHNNSSSVYRSNISLSLYQLQKPWVTSHICLRGHKSPAHISLRSHKTLAHISFRSHTSPAHLSSKGLDLLLNACISTSDQIKSPMTRLYQPQGPHITSLYHLQSLHIYQCMTIHIQYMAHICTQRHFKVQNELVKNGLNSKNEVQNCSFPLPLPYDQHTSSVTTPIKHGNNTFC